MPGGKVDDAAIAAWSTHVAADLTGFDNAMQIPMTRHAVIESFEAPNRTAHL